MKDFVCYDAGTTVKTTTVLCPTCKVESEIVFKGVPDLKGIIVECCSKEIRNKKLRQNKPK